MKYYSFSVFKRTLLVGMSLCLFMTSSSLSSQKATLNTFAEKEILDNGLTLIYQIDQSSSLTVLQIFIKGGKKVEPSDKKGLAFLTTRLAVEIPSRSKIQELMTQATQLSVSCERDYSLIHISCLSENLESTLELITPIITDPLFSGLRINKVEKLMNHYRKREGDDAINLAHNALIDFFFDKTSYAGSIYGSEESLKAIKKRDIKRFYNHYFRAGNMIVSVSTDLNKDKILELCKKQLGQIPAGECPGSEFPSLRPPEENIHYIKKDTQQSLVSMAFALPPLNQKNYVLGLLLRNLLGKGFNSRLWPLRIKERLAYNVNSRITFLKEGGILEAFLETNHQKKDKAREKLKKVLQNLYQNGITEKELKTHQIYSKTFFLRKNESKNSRTQLLARLECLGLGYDFLSRLSQEIDNVTLQQINAYIKKVLNPDISLEMIVGPDKTQNSKHPHP